MSNRKKVQEKFNRGARREPYSKKYMTTTSSPSKVKCGQIKRGDSPRNQVEVTVVGKNSTYVGMVKLYEFIYYISEL